MDSVYALTPVNKTAGVVTGQRGCGSEANIAKDELLELLSRLERKHRLLKRVLGIERKRQHQNLMARYKKAGGVGGHRNPRALDEYVRTGNAMQILHRELAALKKVDFKERGRFYGEFLKKDSAPVFPVLPPPVAPLESPVWRPWSPFPGAPDSPVSPYWPGRDRYVVTSNTQ